MYIVTLKEGLTAAAVQRILAELRQLGTIEDIFLWTWQILLKTNDPDSARAINGVEDVVESISSYHVE